MNKLIILLFISFSTYADNAYDNAKSTGWFWYKEQYPHPQLLKKTEKNNNIQTLSKSQKIFSASWIREKLPALLDQAITNPTENNIKAYKYMERIALDMASNFADISAKVVASDPVLDESVRFPISTFARQQSLWKIDDAKKTAMEKLSKKAGIWMFFDSNCSYCYAQYKALQMLIQKYPIEIRYISTDGRVFQGMKKSQVLFDFGRNKAKSLGIKILPATLLVLPEINKLAIVSHGALSLNELEDKIINLAIQMNIIKEKNIINLENRGILTSEDIQQMKNKLQDLNNIDELVQKLNEMIISKMNKE